MRVRLRSMRAEARVDQRGRGGRVRGTVFMFVERPDHVRLDAMTQLGPAAILTSDGARFSLLDFRENRFLEGAACPSNVARFSGISLSSRDLGKVLLGAAPRIAPHDDAATIECAGDGGYHVRLRAEDGRTQEIVFDVRDGDHEAPPMEQRLRLRATEVRNPDGSPIWRAAWSDYRVLPLDEQGVAMPFTVHFEDLARGLDVLVKFRSIELNAPIPEGAFSQSPPPGILAEEVPCD